MGGGPQNKQIITHINTIYVRSTAEFSNITDIVLSTVISLITCKAADVLLQIGWLTAFSAQIARLAMVGQIGIYSLGAW